MFGNLYRLFFPSVNKNSAIKNAIYCANRKRISQDVLQSFDTNLIFYFVCEIVVWRDTAVTENPDFCARVFPRRH